jgi:hypothetical protein
VKDVAKVICGIAVFAVLVGYLADLSVRREEEIAARQFCENAIKQGLLKSCEP